MRINIAPESAFIRSGRFMVTVISWPSRSTMASGISPLLPESASELRNLVSGGRLDGEQRREEDLLPEPLAERLEVGLVRCRGDGHGHRELASRVERERHVLLGERELEDRSVEAAPEPALGEP